MNRRDLEREAVLAAEYVLAEAGIAPGDRVPVFDLIEDRGIWLSFEPGLDRLLGVYQRIGNASGIAINTARPMTLQRYTAAHELGHHELGHESRFDAEATISESVYDPQEIQAQTFAGSLLMSELTVETRLEYRGHRPDRPDLSATDVYLISAELGVSYQAAVTQLRGPRQDLVCPIPRVRQAVSLSTEARTIGRPPPGQSSRLGDATHVRRQPTRSGTRCLR